MSDIEIKVSDPEKVGEYVAIFVNWSSKMPTVLLKDSIYLQIVKLIVVKTLPL